MKDVKDIVVLVADYGYYISTAECLARTCKRVLYYSPCESEFQSVKNCIYGDGLEKVERCEDFLDPNILKTIDLAVFPDIGFVGLQKHLRDLGIAVWGSFDATIYELYRTQFMDFVKEIGLPVAPIKKIEGLSNLIEHLKPIKDKWVKVDRWRSEMETFRWQDWEHGEGKMDELACAFGATKELVGFVVQDKIETDIEIGYDGWTVDGKYPTSSFYGYEGKNEIYLGALRKYEQLPKEMREVNKAMSDSLNKLGYRNFMSTEIRVKDKTPYFIDPTFRQAGQTCEQLQETCVNLADVIWHGANGELIEPKWKYKFAASATIHYDASGENSWKVLRVPNEISQWVKLSHYCEINGAAHFPPCHTAELGVVLGAGNSIPETFARLKKNVDALSGESVSFALDGFFDLLDAIKEAQKKGLKFSDSPLPTKEQILKFTL